MQIMIFIVHKNSYYSYSLLPLWNKMNKNQKLNKNEQNQKSISKVLHFLNGILKFITMC